jgi:transcriptional regulator with XRE-family HTH domain
LLYSFLGGEQDGYQGRSAEHTEKSQPYPGRNGRQAVCDQAAVSRWENGETIPGAETLKLISKTFGVSLHTLLGQPRNEICQV